MGHLRDAVARLKIFTFLLVTALTLTGVTGCSGGREPAEKITMAVMPWPASAPIYVADEKGYFRDEGLDVELQSFVAGHLALDAMFAGNADFATAADTSIARAAIEGEEIAVIATIATVQQPILIIGRRDMGVNSPGDLRNKRIGLARRSAAEYFLDAYLTTSYIDPDGVQIVDVPDADVVDALTTGKVDAVATWAPYTYVLEERLGENAVVFTDRDLYTMTWNVAVTHDFARDYPDRVARFLRAVIKADAFSKEHPEKANSITAKHLDIEVPAHEGEWLDYSYGTHLDESLVLILEDEARWMLKAQLGGEQTPPNFMEHIYATGLISVLPEAVTVAGR